MATRVRRKTKRRAARRRLAVGNVIGVASAIAAIAGATAASRKYYQARAERQQIQLARAMEDSNRRDAIPRETPSQTSARFARLRAMENSNRWDTKSNETASQTRARLASLRRHRMLTMAP